MAEIVILYDGPIVIRKQAKAKGEKRYFNGKPCPEGHIDERYTGSGKCVACARIEKHNRKHGIRRKKKEVVVSEVLYCGPIISQREAKKLGLNRFFTSKPCKHGHVDQRRVDGGQCMRCVRLQQKKWRRENKAKFRASDNRRQKAWRKNNPELARKRNDRRNEIFAQKQLVTLSEREQKKLEKRQEAEKRREAKKTDPNARREQLDRHKANRDKRLAEVAGRPRPSICDACKGNHHRGIVFDHCHKNRHFRGWLCDRCNKVLGLVYDDPSLLRKLAKYLERTSGATDNKEEEPTPLFDLRRTG